MSERTGTPSDLSKTEKYVLWQLAQHKYGWGYVQGLGRRSAARALERKGLVSISDIGDYRIYLSKRGEAVVAEKWPKSPYALGTYDRPEGGWDLLDGEAA